MEVLTNSEIEYIVDFVEIQKGLPIATATSIMEATKDSFREQLMGQLVFPSIIPELKEKMYRVYNASRIQPGESVGVVAAQSIGERNTQTALNTFHSAGISNKTMTEGVPRFQELLNATHNPRSVNHRIFLKNPVDSPGALRDIAGYKIQGMTLKDLITDIDFSVSHTPESWYKPYAILYNDDFANHSDCVIIKLDQLKMFTYKISASVIANKIQSLYDDLFCVFSPHDESIIHVYVDSLDVYSKLDGTNGYVTEENAIDIYLEDVVQPNLEHIELCGIPDINEIFFSKVDGEWMIETNSDSNNDDTLQILMTLPFVDTERTISNNIWDIYTVLGIEAAKEFLTDEFAVIMDGINRQHGELLVDRMTFSGTIASISRYTHKVDDAGVLAKVSFEQSLDNFLSAAANGEHEKTVGVSASIICGKRSNIGTGMVDLKMDLGESIPEFKGLTI